jgi:hypothetical protein
MPKPRNYWVLRGLRGANARQRLLDYYAGIADIEDNIGQGEAKPPRQLLYLEPFSVPLAVDHIMRDSALQPAWNALSNFAGISTRVAADPGANTPVNLKSYKAPRIIRVTLDATGVRAVSKMTGLPYLKYDHTSESIPFGSGPVGDTVAAAYGEISAAMTDTTHSTRLVNERT